MNDERETALKLEGALGLRDAGEVHERLKMALEAGRTVAVDVREMIEVDISILQLLISARVSAVHRGVELRLVTTRGDAFHSVLEQAGLLVARQ